MPIYEYRCSACGFQKEHLQKLNSAPLTTCPACGAEHYVKQLSAAGFQLKGNGWYATDFKNKGASTSPSATPTTPASSEAAKPDTTSTGCGGACACHPA